MFKIIQYVVQSYNKMANNNLKKSLVTYAHKENGRYVAQNTTSLFGTEQHLSMINSVQLNRTEQ